MNQPTEKSNDEKRTLLDAVLISAWVAAYAGVLIAFRAAKVVEGALSRPERVTKGSKGL